jgi:hypothetical protein
MYIFKYIYIYEYIYIYIYLHKYIIIGNKVNIEKNILDLFNIVKVLQF